MHLLKIGRFHSHLADIRFVREEREGFILHFGEETNIRSATLVRRLGRRTRYCFV